MSTTTPYLGLTLYDSSTDQVVTFATFRAVWGGTATTSNFYKIDTAMGGFNTRITSLENNAGAVSVEALYVSANYYEATGISAISAYNTGSTIILSLDTTSDGTVTLNINSLGIKSVMKMNGTGSPVNLTGIDLNKNHRYMFVYDGTRWLWVGQMEEDDGWIAEGNTWTYSSVDGAQAFSRISTELISMEAFWPHSVGAALAARSLAECSMRYQGERERIFLAALLHDIGQIVMYHQLPEISRSILEAMAEGERRPSVERTMLGFTHADVGAALLERWKLPASLTEPVRYHNRCADAPNHGMAAALVHPCSAVAHHMEQNQGPAGYTGTLAVDAEIWALAGCHPDALETFMLDPLFCMEAKTNPKLAPLQKASFAMIQGDYKLLNYRGYELKKEPPDHELFNLAEDPQELTDLYPSEKGIASELKAILQDTREELTGYIHNDPYFEDPFAIQSFRLEK